MFSDPVAERTIAFFSGRTPLGRAFSGEVLIDRRFETFDVVIRETGTRNEMRFGFAYPDAERATNVARAIVKALAKPIGSGGGALIEWA